MRNYTYLAISSFMLFIGYPSPLYANPLKSSLERHPSRQPLLLNPHQNIADAITIKGKVTSDSGEELIGVNILLKGTTIGTTTDIGGNYSITLPDSKGTLVFSFIGFLPEEISVGNATTMNIKLVPDIKALSEVVVVGYGTQLRKEVTTAISSLKSEEITKTPVLRIEQAMQGRIAGVQVTNVSGQPGDAPTVRIRGIGTSGNSSPIYIVDGFQVGGIDYLNPGDIESMDVLKDAASAAIYGARGANGVVIITTKSGKKDGNMHISYDGYIGVQNPWKQMNLLNAREYAVMMNEGAANAGNSVPYPDVTQFGEGTDWQKALFEVNAPISNHQIVVTGGTAKSSYAANASVFDQTGIVGGSKSNFKRYTFRVNADNQIRRFLKIGTNLVYSQIQRRSFDPNQEFGGILNNAINLDPLTPVYEGDPAKLANYNPNAVRDEEGYVFGISQYVPQEVVNPLARLYTRHAKTRVDKLVGNLYAEAEIIKGLTFRSTFGMDLAFVTSDNYNPIYYLNAAQNNSKSLVSKGVDRYYTWQAENVLNYTKKVDEHNLGFTLGTSALKSVSESVFGSNTGLVTSDPKYAYLSMAVDKTTAVANGGAGESSLLSLFGRVNYNYKGRYLLSAVIRRDGSSRFGQEHAFGSFPSISAGWLVSDEKFFSQFDALNLFKVRASWGQNGNESIGDYSWASTIAVGRGYSFYNNGGPGYSNGASPEKIANPYLKWEASEQTDLGVDLAFFNNAFNVTLDYYIKTTKDWLVTAPIPLIVGNNAPVVNGGNVQNKGLEWALSYRGKAGDFGYTLGLNGSSNQNKVLKIKNAEQVLTGPGIATYGTVSRSTVGEPFAYFWGYKTAGIFQTTEEVQAHKSATGELLQANAQPGDVRFVDYNQDGVIDTKDRTKIGNPTPKVVLGFTLDLTYKSFDLSGFFTGAFGHQIFNGTRRHDLKTANMQAKYLNRWTGPGSTNEYPRFTWNDANGNYTNISDLYIEKGDFVRLKTLQLGYTVPTVLVNKIHLQKIRVYVSGDNLATFTKYTGFDPEIGARGSLDIGIDRGIYPQARTFRMGINATF